MGGINLGHNKDHEVQSDHQVEKVETWKYLAKGTSDNYVPFWNFKDKYFFSEVAGSLRKQLKESRLTMDINQIAWPAKNVWIAEGHCLEKEHTNIIYSLSGLRPLPFYPSLLPHGRK